MSDMTVMGDRQYGRPPVRAAVFTVYFHPFNLDLAVITELRNKWAADYPGFKQAIPVNRSGKMLPPSDILSTSAWPAPAVQLADNSLSRTLAFQFDQLSLTWKFDTSGESSRYPGYSALVDELIVRFSEFISVVDSASGDSVIVQGCRCYYMNSLDGIGAQNWLTSFLTGQPGAASSLDAARNYGFRLYRDDAVEKVKRSVLVQMSAVGKNHSHVDISVLAVPSETVNDPADDPPQLARQLMDAAHDLENQTFESSFSETMKKEWEVQL
ncbi:TIGR04255 family protein [Mycobacteriaceae bacterium NPDC060252]